MGGTSEGLKTTLDLLSTTENEAAVRVLIAGLDNPRRTIRDGVFRAILSRRNLTGHEEVIRRLHTFDQRWMDLLRENSERLRQATRDGLLSPDRQMCVNACRAALWLEAYDLVPTLVSALEDAANPNIELLATTLLELVEQLCADLSDPDAKKVRRDPRLVRGHLVTALQSSLDRYSRHRRREVVDAFLRLVPRDNVMLKQLLQNPHHPAFVTVIDVLSKSTAGGVVRLLLSSLDDPHASSAVLSVIANRSDPKLIRYLLRKVGREPSAAAAQNLKRMRSVSWLQSGPAILAGLDDLAQHGVVRLVMASGIPRLQAFGTIEYLVLHGKAEGRRAAAEALADFQGTAANALALKALEDEDPQVQASIALQLRRRGIPGVLTRLVALLDSRHAEVRQAARKTLAEFSFARFLGAFDMLDDEVRKSTGTLVRKVDPETIPRLRAELESKARTRRLRGLAIARVIEAVEPLEPVIIKLLEDEDHLIRAEAAVALAQSNSESSREALRRAETDRSLAVQQAVSSSLRQQEQFTQWRETLSDPRD